MIESPSLPLLFSNLSRHWQKPLSQIDLLSERLLFAALFEFTRLAEKRLSHLRTEGGVRPGPPPSVSFYLHLSKQTSLLSATAAAPDPAPALSAQQLHKGVCRTARHPRHVCRPRASRGPAGHAALSGPIVRHPRRGPLGSRIAPSDRCGASQRNCDVVWPSAARKNV